MDRRDFLYACADGAAAIAGWVLVPGLARALPAAESPAGPSAPALATGVVLRRARGGGELWRREGDGPGRLVGRVNELGARVVEALDGSRTVAELARRIEPAAPRDKGERAEAAVAAFLAALAEGELLSAPFLVNLWEARWTA